ncbi:rRNA maturation RNase YbeY [Filimonas lacunae]|uniref:Endoribonuclease YbeY n=1 Tax=Filimonas lacunae TaxID=477680 RepID=A0A173MQG8_9BACT|nr:rRNA maturation RNase YbeY [Filimonas lacunae]BAV09736.1 metal-dependent hydrolase YbeY [Filimonas lacunae]SIS78161.1 rRNA maturation RNase YbeY [Filimonas lacunae]
MKKVHFNYADRKLSLTGKENCKQHIEYLFSKEKKKLEEIRYIFCSDEYLLQINKDFLQHDYYTDIITFDLSEGDATTSEVYISVDRVKENAITQGTTFTREMLRVLFHGALHLCGYKDKTKDQVSEMRKKEEQYILSFEKKYK